ncbi:hypothetical protein [Sulfurovum sp.]|uniref:hypothetical protein n=1 Tax=Sulfurovum sp. TaxID=1969726 RepID=UPI0025DDFBA9|nr:hypothetical protein [Sulfurovum sp.]
MLILRPAIAMIELIFAIVVIGITLLSAPLVLNQSIQSSNVALQQESIAAAASQISLILTQSWDENDTNKTGILTVNGGDSELAVGTRDLNLSYLSRSMNPAQFINAAPANRLSREISDNNISDDVDDYNGLSSKITVYNTEESKLENNIGEYVDKSISIANTVSYAKDSTNYANSPIVFNNPFQTSSISTNIKLISVTLTSTSGASEYNKSIVLSAFVCNIGTPNVISVPLQP